MAAGGEQRRRGRDKRQKENAAAAPPDTSSPRMKNLPPIPQDCAQKPQPQAAPSLVNLFVDVEDPAGVHEIRAGVREIFEFAQGLSGG